MSTLPIRTPDGPLATWGAYWGTQPLSKVTGEPINQLLTTRPPLQVRTTGFDPSLKVPPLLEELMSLFRINRTSPYVRLYARQAAINADRQARLAAGPRVRLGTKGSGIAFYQSPRLKPRAPLGRSDIPAPVGQGAYRGVRALELKMPKGTAHKLTLEGKASDAAGPRRIAGKMGPAKIAIDADHAKSLVNRALGSSDSGGFERVLFLGAAVFVAVLVLRTL